MAMASIIIIVISLQNLVLIIRWVGWVEEIATSKSLQTFEKAAPIIFNISISIIIINSVVLANVV